MKITFAIPYHHLTGGIRCIFELSNALAERGHDCLVVSPFQPYPMGETILGKVKRSIFAFADCASRNWKGDTNGNGTEGQADWIQLKFTYKAVRYLTNPYLPEGDYVVATNWKTASWVRALDESKGKKRYLVFDIETWDRGTYSESDVEKTYHLIPHIMTYSSFVSRELGKLINRKPTAMFTLGVNQEKFYPDYEIEKDNSKIRVCMMMRRQPHKGMEDGLRVFDLVRKKCPQISLIAFGSREVEESVPSYVEFHRFPDDDELRKIYSSCHIFLSTSRREGFNLTPLEAMACGCAVVSTRTGAIPEYGTHKETMMIREVGDVEGLAGDIVKLCSHPDEIKRLSRNSSQVVNKYSWDAAAESFERALEI